MVRIVGEGNVSRSRSEGSITFLSMTFVFLREDCVEANLADAHPDRSQVSRDSNSD
jgi:hypothetical protein